MVAACKRSRNNRARGKSGVRRNVCYSHGSPFQSVLLGEMAAESRRMSVRDAVNGVTR